ncbi:TIGR01621 family pseudouridine synthase [Haemophilus haemolyticus]|uniref:TIGR01621 family pseudouridine synthase n=1 Tax=Haemophilus haemolyticus TaxID=726 RepID=UPI000E58A765|nr:TIGR01621 family pseudouridine synthase [Haemophilus haemolyticus]
MKIEVVYQHSDFIIINKPEGISVHKDQEEQGLTELVAKQLNVPQVWLVHRLDKVTSGLLILALNAESAAEFSRLFSEHKIYKTYLALSNQKPKKKQGLIIGDMKKARDGAWKLCQTKDNPAITRFESVSCEPNLRLFILKPQTGKTHQLRVAMKSLGSPILGDGLYGKNIEKIDRTYLHAAQLEFDYLNDFISVTCLPSQGQFWIKSSVFEQIKAYLLKPFLSK